jgi:GT2 family glycosyltransferase
MKLSVLRERAGRTLGDGLNGSAPGPGRLPLSALRGGLDEASAGTNWLLNPDGVLGRALLIPAGKTFTVPLRLANDVSFSARAMLLPHDWRDGRGAVRVSVAIIEVDGRGRVIWSGLLRASDRGKPRGRRIQCRLPASATSLQLSVEADGALRPRSVARAIWVDPAITDPHAAPLRALPAATAAVPHASPASQGPLISVLIPVHDPPPHMLEEAIASVRAQTFTDWELCLVDDGSTDPQIIAALRRHAASDPRIHLKRREHAGGIATATNAALDLATGQYIALLDHDDTLAPDALQHVADRIATDPDLDMIYSDEDVVGDGGLIERHPKPGWSPEHMSALMYTCHLGVYRRTLAVDLGGFRSQFDGCQDYDFVLRLMERTDRIAHIPRILYHWRAHASSTAGTGEEAKPLAYLSQPGAIAEHLQRTGVDAEVQFAQLPGVHRVVHRVDPSISVDLVLAVDSDHGLKEAAASWLAQPHPSWKVVLAAPKATLRPATNALTDAGIPEARITTIITSPAQDLASALADAAEAATAEYVLLMQTPAAGLTHDWLTRLIGYSQRPDIAAAGPVLLAPDARIQQAGIAIPEGIPLHVQYGLPAAAAPVVVYNVSAVSGLVVTRRATYRKLGGLDPRFKDLTLIDYCLRATERHHRIVIVPDSRLRSTGPDSIVNDVSALWRLRESWAQTHGQDVYYNRNYRTDRGDAVMQPLG